MLDLALRSAVILAVAWIIAASLRRATAATRHLVWHLAIAFVLAAPLLRPLMVEWSVPLPAAFDSAKVAARLSAQIPEFQSAKVPEFAKARVPERDGTIVDRADTRWHLGTLALWHLGTLAPWNLIWSAGSAVFVLWFFIGWLSTAVTVRRARAAPAEWQLEVNALGERMRITQHVRLRIVAANTSPMATGLWRSTLLLPSTAVGWDPDRRRTVLLHELAHVRRGDCRVHALAQAACVLYWFNPLVWTAFARLRSERERACDDEVLRSGAQPSAYAAHLLEIARELGPVLRPSAALAMARPSELEGRLLAVLAAGRTRVPARATRWVIAATLAAAAAAALGATPVDSGLPAPAPGQQTVPSRALFVPTQDPPTTAARVAARRARAEASQTLASSPDPQERARAAVELSASGEIETIRPLETALNDASQDVREKAALGLALLSSPEVIPALLKALEDPDSQVREKAAIGLALRRDPRVVEALIRAMNDPDSQVREKAAIALGTSGDPRAAAVLERALHDEDSQVREKAVTGLILLRNTASDPQQGERVRDGVRGLVSALMGLR